MSVNFRGFAVLIAERFQAAARCRGRKAFWRILWEQSRSSCLVFSGLNVANFFDKQVMLSRKKFSVAVAVYSCSQLAARDSKLIVSIQNQWRIFLQKCFDERINPMAAFIPSAALEMIPPA